MLKIRIYQPFSSPMLYHIIGDLKSVIFQSVFLPYISSLGFNPVKTGFKLSVYWQMNHVLCEKHERIAFLYFNSLELLTSLLYVFTFLPFPRDISLAPYLFSLTFLSLASFSSLLIILLFPNILYLCASLSIVDYFPRICTWPHSHQSKCSLENQLIGSRHLAYA